MTTPAERRTLIHAIPGLYQRDATWAAHQQINANRTAITNIRRGLRELHTLEQRRYAERAIHKLALENEALEQKIAEAG